MSNGPYLCRPDGFAPSVPETCAFEEWVFVPVSSKEEIVSPSRDHAYVLPDESVWVLNHDGDGLHQIGGGGVLSFAGRAGNVVPRTGDYTAEMVGAIPISQLEELKARLDAMERTVAESNAKVQTMWDAIFNDITGNLTEIAFDSLDGVTLTSGVWNLPLQRLEC